MAIDSSLIVFAGTATAVIGLIASSAFIGFQAGRRTAPESTPPLEQDPIALGRMPERVVRELHTCLDLADCVVRDADALGETAEHCMDDVPRELTSAIGQLRKTIKGLIGRLQQVAGERLSRSDERRANAAGQRSEKELPPAPDPPVKAAATVAAEGPSSSAKQPDGVANPRKFGRTPCAGARKAT